MANTLDKATSDLLALAPGLVGEDRTLTWRSRFESERSTPLRVAFVGQFNAGKSSLINALLGEPLLPVDALPTSSVIVEITHGAERRFDKVCGTETETVDEATFRELARTVSEPTTSLRATLPSAQFDPGVVLVDTPGVASLELAHTAVTYGYLPQCDAVVLVTDGIRGELTSGELDFVRCKVLEQTRKRLLVAVTRADRLSADARTRVATGIAESLSRHCGLTPDVSLVACVEPVDIAALMASLRGGQLAEARAGRLRRRWQMVTAAVTELTAAVAARHAALDAGAAGARAELERLAEDRKEARASAERRARDFERARDDLLAELDQKVGEVIDRLVARVPAYVETLGSTSDGDKVPFAARMQAELVAELERLATDWLAPRMKRFAREGVSALDAKIAIARPDTSLPGEGLIDTMVEGLVLVVLNLLLPGQWLEALVARVLGVKILDRILGPIKQQVADLVRAALSGFVRSALAKKLEASIREMREPLRADLRLSVARVLESIGALVREENEARLNAVYRASEDAAKAHDAGAAEVAALRVRLNQASNVLSGLRDAAEEAGR